MTKESCSLPVESGDCDNLLERFYFDIFDAECKPFVYSGCGGNTNNFNSLDACNKLCGSGGYPTEVDTFEQGIYLTLC